MGNSPAIYGGSRTKILTSKGLLLKDGTTIDYDGAINYITRNDGLSITGWATYADAAGTSPVDGTGGSANVTFATSTNSDIRGTTNFLFTHDAANRQGQGFSYNFTIDKADQAKMLTVSFDYLVASGTYADGDLTVWIYDVTNATLIQPAPYKILNAIGSQTWQGEFQTASNSTSYRLIVHVTTSTATAYTMRFDNFALGPDIGKNMGVPFTDWSATFTGSDTSNNSTVTYKWRRDGDTMEIDYYVTFSGTGDGGTFALNMVSGYSVDSTKTLQGTVGYFRWFDSGTSHKTGTVNYGNTTQFTLLNDGASAAIDGSAFANGDIITARIRVPITGWSSNTVMSSDAATNVVAANYETNTAQNITNTTITFVNFEDKVIDTNNAAVLGSGPVTTAGTGWRYVVPVSGYYRVNATLTFTDFSAVNTLIGYIYRNTTAISRDTVITQAVSANWSIAARALYWYNAGDTIQAGFYQSTGSTQTTLASSGATRIEIERISGPAQIAASETVAVEVSTTAGQSIPNNSATQITFGTTEGDSTGSWSSNTFTAPISGRYLVAANINYNANGTGLRTLEIQANGTTAAIIVTPTVTGVDFSLALTKSVRLLAGQTIKIYTQQTSGGNLALTTNTGRNTLSIVRTGNY